MTTTQTNLHGELLFPGRRCDDEYDYYRTKARIYRPVKIRFTNWNNDEDQEPQG